MSDPTKNLPHTPRVTRVLEIAEEEARMLGYNYVGTEHLLLAILREAEGMASTAMVEKGLNYNVARNLVPRVK